ncbi:MAG: ADP-polyphosphate phosphotransferase [Elusimicrobiota bacterium]
MRIKSENFRVREGKKVKLKKWPTRIEPFYRSKKDYQDMLGEHIRKMVRVQDIFYAANRYALLLIFQAMDAAGKDGAIKHVMSGLNPQGCQVFSFKRPSAEELEHDFLWRAYRRLPERGHIGIFNRSYYEEVLIARVHPDILRGENLPNSTLDGKHFWRRRYGSIIEMENHLHLSGTRILKFFLHLSKDEQRKRFMGRIDEPDKNWKLSMADIEERNFWDIYRKAYEDCLSQTSTKVSPWHVIPADDKKNARLIISQIILDEMETLEIAYPKTDAKRRQELQSIRNRLAMQ